MNKSKIEWLSQDGRPGYSWNPIKGICPVGCWYCYARRMYQRFKKPVEPRLDEKEVFEPINSFRSFRKFARIFVCSTFELFHPVADKWRDLIFQTIELDKYDTFIILTKMPERIDRPMPENVWLGVSITQTKEVDSRMNALHKADARLKFISFEPLFADVSLTRFPYLAGEVNWIIVGRLTGHGNKYNPMPEKIWPIFKACNDFKIPLFMKDNLMSIWPEPLIQEYPKASKG